MKKCFVLILSIVILVASFTFTAFADEPTARLYNVYGDNMLFGQNRESFVAGKASPGTPIGLILRNSQGEIVYSSVAVTGSDGEFVCSLQAPEGSYEEYSVEMYTTGECFAVLRGVVFGELWLASGQSNMQYCLSESAEGKMMFAEGRKASKWMRVFYAMGLINYNGSYDNVPVFPQSEIPDCFWGTGEENTIGKVSAVAYFFAEKLMAELDMPVGIINSSLGGSSVISWLSHEDVENDEAVKNDLIAGGDYFSLNEKNENEINVFYDLAANYNNKIYAERFFRPTGMIWYQGETDVILNRNGNRYVRFFNLLQSSYSELFGFENELMPVIISQLAAFDYGTDDKNPQNMNITFSEMQQLEPDSRAVISIYDIGLDYYSELGPIHPAKKKEIGLKMADSAMGFVYGSSDTFTTATVKNVELKDESVFVSFRNTGLGLMCPDAVLKGFAVCGADGIYVNANAEIVSSDTVRIYSDVVKNPVSATYAYSENNSRANLFVTDEEGNKGLGVSPFVTDKSVGVHYASDSVWMDCDDETAWFCDADEPGFYSVWSGDNATLLFTGTHMNVRTDKSLGGKNFSVSPLYFIKKGVNRDYLTDNETDFSDYGTISLNIRNNGSNPVVLNEIQFFSSVGTWYSPEFENSGTTSAVIEPDGEYHTLTFNLNSLYFDGFALNSVTNEKLSGVKNIKFRFSDYSGCEADIDVDNITLAPEKSEISHKNIISVFVSRINFIKRIFNLFIASC